MMNTISFKPTMRTNQNNLNQLFCVGGGEEIQTFTINREILSPFYEEQIRVAAQIKNCQDVDDEIHRHALSLIKLIKFTSHGCQALPHNSDIKPMKVEEETKCEFSPSWNINKEGFKMPHKRIFFGELVSEDEFKNRDANILAEAWELFRIKDTNQGYKNFNALLKLREGSPTTAISANAYVMEHYKKYTDSPKSDTYKLHAELEQLRATVVNLPSDEEIARLRKNDTYRLHLRERVSNALHVKHENIDMFVKMIEDVTLSVAIASRSFSFTDIMLACLTFAKFRLADKPLLAIDNVEMVYDFVRSFVDKEFREDFLYDDCQTLPHNSIGKPAIGLASDVLAGARDILDRYNTIHTKPLVKKLMKCLMVILARSMTDEDKVDMKSSMWSEFLPEIEKKVTAPNLVFAVADAVTYVGERVVLAIKAGSAEVFWAETTSYEDWYKQCYALKLQAKYLNDPERHGIVLQKFYLELNRAIVKGEAMTKVLDKIELKSAHILLNALKEIKHERLGYEAGAEMREAAFAVVITAASNNMKTSLTSVLHKSFCNYFKLPDGDEHVYNHLFAAKFWTGCDSTKLIIFLDDMSALLASHPMAAEAMKDFIHMQNNNPFSPPQAALEDKNRCHLKHRLCIGSTNTPRQDFKSLFNNPYAFARRWDMYVDLEPKDEYRMTGKNSMHLDPNKVPVVQEGEYPDYWIIRVYTVVAHNIQPVNPLNYGGEADCRVNQDFDFVHEKTFTSIYAFIAYFLQKCDVKHQNQLKYLEFLKTIGKGEKCTACGCPRPHCICCHHCGDHFLLRQLHKDDCPLEPKCAKCDHGTILPHNARFTTEHDWGIPEPTRWQKLWAYLAIAWWYLMPFADIQVKRSRIAENMIKLPFLRTKGYGLLARTVVHEIVGPNFYEKYKAFILIASIFTMFGAMFSMLHASNKSKLHDKTTDDFVCPRNIEKQENNDIANARIGAMVMADRKCHVLPPNICLKTIEAQLGAKSLPPDEKPRPDAWPRKTFELSTFEVGNKTISWSKIDVQDLAVRLIKNTRRVKVEMNKEYGESMIFGVCDHVYLINAHAISDFPCTMIAYRDKSVISSKKEFIVQQKQAYRINADVYALYLPYFETVADLRGLFAKIPVDGKWPGFIAGLTLECDPLVKRCHGVNVEMARSTEGIDSFPHLMYLAHFVDHVYPGDCGAVWCIRTNAGPVLLGIHSLGLTTTGACEILLRDQLDTAVKAIHPTQPIDSGVIVLGKHSLTSVHGKAPINFLASGRLTVVGSLNKRAVKYKSNITQSLLYGELKALNMMSVKVIPQELDTYKPWHIALKARSTDGEFFKLEEYELAAKQYLRRVFRQLKTDIKAEFITVKQAINGIPGVAHFHALDFNTSMGYPYNIGKKQYRIGEIGNYSFIPEIMDEIARNLECMRNGQRCNPIFTASPKDEVISEEKLKQGKNRVFMGAPTPWVVAGRMVLSWLSRVMQSNPYIFECMAGMNVESDEWDVFVGYLKSKGINIFAGDYKGFDEYPDTGVAIYVMYVIRELAKHLGASDEMLKMIDSIGNDIIYFVVWFWNVLIVMCGNTPSGVFITLLINCIKNSLYFRCVYNRIYPGRDLFDEDVAMATMGDDNVVNVSDDVPEFNQKIISETFAQVGITYTDTNKSGVVSPYINFGEVEFVKRKCVYSEDYGCYVCPIDEQSIFKALAYRDAKSACSEEQHAVQVVENALRQYSRYPRAVFDDKKVVLRNLIESKVDASYLTKSPIYWEYDDYIIDWKKKNAYVCYDYPWDFKRDDRIYEDAVRENRTIDEVVLPHNSGLRGKVAKPNTLKTKIPHIVTVTVDDKLLYFKPNLRVGSNVTLPGRSPNPYQGVSGNGTPKKYTPRKLKSAHRVNKRLNKQLKQLKDEASVYNEMNDCVVLPHQASKPIIACDEDTTSAEQVGVISFADDKVVTEYVPYGMRQVYDKTADTFQLKEWFSRPFLIDTYTAQISDPQFTTHVIQPWKLFLTNYSNEYKLYNFAFLRCTLVIRIEVSATQFLYGEEGFFYVPSTSNGVTGTSPYGTATTLAANSVHLVLLSQTQAAYMAPDDDVAIEMELPFIYNRNYLSLADSFATGSVNLSDFGALHYYRLVALQSANGASSDGVTFNTFCYAKNLELAGPTTALPFQSKRKKDEYGEGPVSGPASAVAALAGWFTKLPFIGPYATATQIGATSIGNAAAALGYTNVPVIDNISSFRPVANPPFASAEIGFPFEKLTIDPKNELTVDNSAIGLSNEDEMAISKFIEKEALVQYITWGQASTESTTLGGWVVSPSYLAAADVTTYGAAYPVFYTAPVAYISQLFSYWRGDLILRFRIVASKFHKGRLSIRYDPSGSPTSSNNVVNTDQTNLVMRQIIDIAETRDFEMRIPYMQHIEWLETSQFLTTGGNVVNGALTFSHMAGVDNGTVVISVMNELTAPVTSANVTILVFARGAENLEFAGPSRLNARVGAGGAQYALLPPQSKRTPQQFSFGPPSKPKPERFLTNFGEAYKSLRQILRRVSPLMYVTETFGYYGTFSYVWQVLTSRFGGTYGWDPNGFYQAEKTIGTGTASFNFNLLHPMHWVMCCYLGVRGSTNWVSTLKLQDGNGSLGVMTTNDFAVVRTPFNTQVQTLSANLQNTNNNGAMAYQWSLGANGLPSAGIAMTDTSVQPTLAFTAPNYSKYFYSGTNPLNLTAPVSTTSVYADDSGYDYILQSATIDNRTNGGGAGSFGTLICSVGIGTDFNLLHFLHVPPVYQYSSAPLAG